MRVERDDTFFLFYFPNACIDAESTHPLELIDGMDASHHV